jgi:hypothetical protein
MSFDKLGAVDTIYIKPDLFNRNTTAAGMRNLSDTIDEKSTLLSTMLSVPKFYKTFQSRVLIAGDERLHDNKKGLR